MRKPDPNEVERIIQIKNAARDRLMAIPGVNGLGVGFKRRAGEFIDELSILVYVDKKQSIAELSTEHLIPEEIDGVKTDVEVSVPAVYYGGTDLGRYRPLVGGSRISWNFEIRTGPRTTTTTTVAGTLGCIAIARKTNEEVFLTNAHVIVQCDNASTAIGKRVGQPDKSSDYTCCSKTWSTVAGSVIAAENNGVIDVAVVKIDKCVDANPEIREIGTVKGSLTTAEINALLNQPVKMRGATTGEIQNGFVRDVSYDDVLVKCDDGDPSNSSTPMSRKYSDVIKVEPVPSNSFFGQPGDSGSAVVDSGNKIIGLLFAGPKLISSSSRAHCGYVCRIDNIFSAFKAKLDLKIKTASSASTSTRTTTVSSFAMAPEATAGDKNFTEPNPEDLKLLKLTRDHLLVTPGGRYLQLTITKHVQEIRRLIDTQKKVAVVWRRIAAPSLLNSTIKALHSPGVSISRFVEGPTLYERGKNLVDVLARYGSEQLVKDLSELLEHVKNFQNASYEEILDWMQTPPKQS